MSAVATAIVGGAVVTGYMGNKAAGKAADASSAASAYTTDEQARQFDLTRSDTAPYREAGGNALASLMARLNAGNGANADLPQFTNTTQLPAYQGSQQFQFDPSRMANNPAYKFAFDQAMEGVNRSAAASGKLNSGNVLAALQDRASGLASTEYANEFNRQLQASDTNYGRGVTDFGINRQGSMDQYNRNLGEFNIDYQRSNDIYGRDQNHLNWLSTVAGVGQNANAMSANAGSNMANAIGNIQMSNAANQGNAAAMKYGAINNAVQGGMSNYLTYNALKPSGYGGGGYGGGYGGGGGLNYSFNNANLSPY